MPLLGLDMMYYLDSSISVDSFLIYLGKRKYYFVESQFNEIQIADFILHSELTLFHKPV